MLKRSRKFIELYCKVANEAAETIGISKELGHHMMQPSFGHEKIIGKIGTAKQQSKQLTVKNQLTPKRQWRQLSQGISLDDYPKKLAKLQLF